MTGFPCRDRLAQGLSARLGGSVQQWLDLLGSVCQEAIIEALQANHYNRYVTSDYIIAGWKLAWRKAVNEGWRPPEPFPPTHIPTLTRGLEGYQGRGEWKLRFWGLAYEAQGRDEDGHYPLIALNDDGVRFFLGEHAVQACCMTEKRPGSPETPIGFTGEYVTGLDIPDSGEVFSLRTLYAV